MEESEIIVEIPGLRSTKNGSESAGNGLISPYDPPQTSENPLFSYLVEDEALRIAITRVLGALVRSTGFTGPIVTGGTVDVIIAAICDRFHVNEDLLLDEKVKHLNATIEANHRELDIERGRVAKLKKKLARVTRKRDELEVGLRTEAELTDDYVNEWRTEIRRLQCALDEAIHFRDKATRELDQVRRTMHTVEVDLKNALSREAALKQPQPEPDLLECEARLEHQEALARLKGENDVLKSTMVVLKKKMLESLVEGKTPSSVHCIKHGALAMVPAGDDVSAAISSHRKECRLAIYVGTSKLSWSTPAWHSGQENWPYASAQT